VKTQIRLIAAISLLFFLFAGKSFASGPGRGQAAFSRSHYSHKILKDSLKTRRDTSDTTHITKRRKFEWGAHYASDATYQGRRDSVSHLIMSPSFSYTGVHGFNASLTASHVEFTAPPVKTKKGAVVATSPKARPPLLDEYDLALGWDHDWTKNFSTSVQNTHSYFDAKSPRLRSTIDNDFNIGATYDFDYLVADASGDWAHGPKSKYGQAKDYFYSFSLSHDFDFDEIFHTRGEFEIEPKISMSYGTQNFYKLYIKAGTPETPAQQQAIDNQKQLSKFNVLNYVFAVPLTYTYKKVAFSLEWDYNMPQNVATGTSSSPYSVIMFDFKYTRKGKLVKVKKRKWDD
jgi:hypothetical protein